MLFFKSWGEWGGGDSANGEMPFKHAVMSYLILLRMNQYKQDFRTVKNIRNMSLYSIH